MSVAGGRLSRPPPLFQTLFNRFNFQLTTMCPRHPTWISGAEWQKAWRLRIDDWYLSMLYGTACSARLQHSGTTYSHLSKYYGKYILTETCTPMIHRIVSIALRVMRITHSYQAFYSLPAAFRESVPIWTVRCLVCRAALRLLHRQFRRVFCAGHLVNSSQHVSHHPT